MPRTVPQAWLSGGVATGLKEFPSQRRLGCCSGGLRPGAVDDIREGEQCRQLGGGRSARPGGLSSMPAVPFVATTTPRSSAC